MFILGGDQVNKYLLVSCHVSPSIPPPRPQTPGWGMNVVMIARTFYYRDNKASCYHHLKGGYIIYIELQLSSGYLKGDPF